ncbi:MAG: aldo/keto reductase [Planctomycetaceae bacterium]|nr:aldo/keto reductase [Planctomycetaceae bacterium]
MNYRLLGRTGVKVSELCLGTMMFGGPTDEAESIRIIHRGLDAGINFLDTADMYTAGKSEEVVGKALVGRRDDVVLATKGCNPMGTGVNQQGLSRRWLMQALDASLKRLQTDYLDIYYAHKPDPTVPWEETLRALDDMVRQGKVRYTACSNFRAWKVSEALWTSDKHGWERFSCVQPLYNLVNRDVEVELLPLCQAQQLGVVTYSPLARGILTGKYRTGQPFPEGSRAARNDKRMKEAELREASFEVAQKLTEYCEQKEVATSAFALAWVLANPIITSVILGPRTMEQFEDNLRCEAVHISKDDEAFVDTLVPPGEHSGKGFQDTAYPITGRPHT